MKNLQASAAELFLQLHQDPKLLVLPNAWDLLSAKFIETCGFPAVATASVATALSNGYPDGEKIPFTQLLQLVGQIANSLTVPLTVDIERGFADNLPRLKENIRLLIEHGAVGVNIEDGKDGKQGLVSIDEQCKRIEAARETAIKCGIPLVINARIDLFLQDPGGQHLKELTERTLAYKKAGADCIYPIMISNYDEIETLIKETGALLNVNLLKSISDWKKLESIGISRISLGPGLMYHMLGNMYSMVKDLQQYDTTKYFNREPLPEGFLERLLV